MDDQGDYLLNGYNVITQYPRVFPYGGVTFEYTGTNSTLERVNSTFARRLKRDLVVEILSRTNYYTVEELIRYTYTMALNEPNGHTNFYPYNYNNVAETTSTAASAHPHHHRHQHEVHYKWEMSEWSECTRLCNGERFRTAACVRAVDGQTVAPEYCRQAKPDDEYAACNTECEVSWEVTRSKCSAQCGEGTQMVTQKCIKTTPHINHRVVVDDSECPQVANTKSYEKCMGPCSSATWTYDEWGTVSGTISLVALTISSYALLCSARGRVAVEIRRDQFTARRICAAK